MSSTKVELIFGGSGFSTDVAPLGTFDDMKEALCILKNEGVCIIDTASTYGDSEKILGELVYYLHSPDRRVPWEPQLSAMTTLHQEGKIKCFGLSNFLAAEVEDIIRIAKENNFGLPTHGIKFYAYSPIAGGFLAKDPDQLRYPRGRWDPSTFVGGLYHLLYNKPQMLEGLKLWGNIAEGYGVSKVELAYRWIVYHFALKGEFGDKIIFRSKNSRQLKDTLQIEEVWELVENEAPLDNYNDGILKMQGMSV
ncbi:NADP-dependent oxidoreductase domain-containing protein [Aspergillus insuetus]